MAKTYLSKREVKEILSSAGLPSYDGYISGLIEEGRLNPICRAGSFPRYLRKEVLEITGEPAQSELPLDLYGQSHSRSLLGVR